MNIRPAKTDDLTDILSMYNDAILNTTAVYEYEPFTETYINHWFKEKEASHFPVLIAENESGILGFATYGTFRHRSAYRTTAEHSVYVKSEFQGQGFGKILLDAILEEAKRNGIHVLVGGIDSSNLISIQLHQKFGFEEVARMKEVAFKFDKWLDLVLMQKIL